MLTVKDCTQQTEINLLKTFSPVTKLIAMRVLLGVVAAKD